MRHGHKPKYCNSLTGVKITKKVIIIRYGETDDIVGTATEGSSVNTRARNPD